MFRKVGNREQKPVGHRAVRLMQSRRIYVLLVRSNLNGDRVGLTHLGVTDLTIRSLYENAATNLLDANQSQIIVLFITD